MFGNSLKTCIGERIMKVSCHITGRLLLLLTRRAQAHFRSLHQLLLNYQFNKLNSKNVRNRKITYIIATICLKLFHNSSDGRVVWSVCLLSSRLGFNSESGQTNDSKIGIHSFPASRSALKGQSEEQAGKYTCCAVGKGT